MARFESSLLFGAMALAIGCSRVASPDDELGDDEAQASEISADESGDTLAVDGESGSIEDLPADESTTGSDCEHPSSGPFLLALETPLGPGPILSLATLEFACPGPTATFEIQVLSAQMPHVPVGDPWVYEAVEFDAMGNFVLDMGLILIPGEANPIGGSDVELTLVLAGHVVHEDALCGDASGTLISPLRYDLAGSTFAMLRVPGLDALPTEFPARCDQVPPP